MGERSQHLEDIDLVARALCEDKDGVRCPCHNAEPCLAMRRFRREAVAVVAALTARHRLITSG